MKYRGSERPWAARTEHHDHTEVMEPPTREHAGVEPDVGCRLDPGTPAWRRLFGASPDTGEVVCLPGRAQFSPAASHQPQVLYRPAGDAVDRRAEAGLMQCPRCGERPRRSGASTNRQQRARQGAAGPPRTPTHRPLEG